MTLDLPPNVAAHVAVAVKAHIRQLQRDGHQPPPQLTELPARLLEQARAEVDGPPSAAEDGGAAVVPVLPVVDAARRAGVSRWTLARRAEAGLIRSVQVGSGTRRRHRRYFAADVEQMIGR